MNSKQESETKLRDEVGYDDDCQFIFPQRLMSVLSDERNSDAICWLPHGRAFIIRDRKSFSEKIMPKFFPRKSLYSSFTRKLNRWNFVRVSSGPEIGAYYHEFFLRDKPHLAAQMFCKNARTKIAMASSDPSPASRVAEGQVEKAKLQPEVAKAKDLPSHVDAAQLRFERQPVDPALSLLLEQQLALCQQERISTHVQSSIGNPHLILGSLLQQRQQDQNPLQQQLEIAKQQQDRMFQLQQLMALSLQRRRIQNRRNNFRASAA